MKEVDRFFVKTGSQVKGAVSGAMLGYRCFKYGRKPFMFFDEDSGNAVAFKLSGAVKEEALALAGASIFNPGDKNRPMRNWVLLPYSQRRQWQRFADVAFQTLKKKWTSDE